MYACYCFLVAIFFSSTATLWRWRQHRICSIHFAAHASLDPLRANGSEFLSDPLIYLRRMAESHPQARAMKSWTSAVLFRVKNAVCKITALLYCVQTISSLLLETKVLFSLLLIPLLLIGNNWDKIFHNRSCMCKNDKIISNL